MGGKQLARVNGETFSYVGIDPVGVNDAMGIA